MYLLLVNSLAVIIVVGSYANVFGEGDVVVRDNVVFYKTNEVSTTRAKWLATLVIDFDEIDNFFSLIAKDIERARTMLQEAIATYLNKTMYEPFREALQGLLSEIMYLDKILCDICEHLKKISNL